VFPEHVTLMHETATHVSVSFLRAVRWKQRMNDKAKLDDEHDLCDGSIHIYIPAAKMDFVSFNCWLSAQLYVG
jgi:hypothetical protein